MSDNLEGYEPGTLCFHELVYALDNIRAAFECEVLEHPAVRRNPEWMSLSMKAKVIFDALHKQASGKENEWFETLPEAAE
jgi:hypothetical protein